jgi:hypothetical protein
MVPVGLEDDDAAIASDELPLEEPQIDEAALRQSGAD